MTRYVTRRARAYFPLQVEDDWTTDPVLPNLDVPDHEASFTGLLNAKGEEIWREPRPVGFGRDDDW